jgi:hypothetical protein
MNGDDLAVIERPMYDETDHAVRLADTLLATPVTPAMWSYQQGTYPVLRDFLEHRQGRALTSDEFDEFRRLTAAVEMTLELLPKLDAMLTPAAETAVRSHDLGLAEAVVGD